MADEERTTPPEYFGDESRAMNVAGGAGSRVAPLKSLDDFEVADDFPDPRGWNVVLANGEKIGEVEDLIVDTGALRTRYLDVKVDGDKVGIEDDRQVLIPVGAARLDDERDNVVLDSTEARQIAALPAFDRGEITRDYESSVVSAFGSTDNTTEWSNQEGEFYRNRSFDDNRFYGSRWGRSTETRSEMQDRDEARVTRAEEELAIGKRRVEAGEVNVEKHVETERVSKPVTVMREEVTVERRPVADRMAGDATIGEDEIVVPVTEEEIVVEKRPVVKEEIVIRKHAVEDTKEVEADVRKERVEIDDSSRQERLDR
ncbi:MAG TPA: DUF2382 domain-containing protein [Gemmatimonadaceae bacterium]|nr:DUF2382 domain-containing protein [Gemmatimonadaceae bacterium]